MRPVSSNSFTEGDREAGRRARGRGGDSWAAGFCSTAAVPDTEPAGSSLWPHLGLATSGTPAEQTSDKPPFTPRSDLEKARPKWGSGFGGQLALC